MFSFLGAGSWSESWAPTAPSKRPDIEPTEALNRGAMVLSEEQVACWRTKGYALVNGVLPLDLLEHVKAAAASSFPAAGSAESEALTDFGGGTTSFPTQHDSINAVPLHPRLLTAVGQLLGSSNICDVRLTQSEIWPKYGRAVRVGESDNSDQRMHCDYPNHTLTHPPPWDQVDAVECILYLDDVERCGGATAVVARTGPDDPAYTYPITNMPGVGSFEWVNDKESAESYLSRVAPHVAAWRDKNLYPREQQVKFRFGTILFYRHDTWHRGTPILPGVLRIVHNMTFRRQASEWISTLHTGWAWAMYSKQLRMEHLIAQASVEQRCVLGFPSLSSTYWNKDTLLAVAARYGPLGFDIAPYEAAFRRRTAPRDQESSAGQEEVVVVPAAEAGEGAAAK